MTAREAPRATPKWIWAFAALALLAVPTFWLLAHRLSSPGPPRWTEADLPEPPPREGNGWARALSLHPSGFEQPTLDELLDTDAPLADRVASWERGAGTLAMDADARAASIAGLTDAFTLPRFRDACPTDPLASCEVLRILHAERFVALEILRRAHEGDWDGAFALDAALLRAFADYVDSARSLLGLAVAAVGLERAIALSELLVDRAVATGADEAAWADARRAALEALAGYERAPLDPARGVVAEYVLARAALSLVVDAPPDPSTLLLDRGATTAWIDAHYAALHDYASGRTATLPPVEDPTGGFAWWAYNPAGKQLVAMLVPGLGPQIERQMEARDRLARRVAALRGSLGAVNSAPHDP